MSPNPPPAHARRPHKHQTMRRRDLLATTGLGVALGVGAYRAVTVGPTLGEIFGVTSPAPTTPTAIDLPPGPVDPAKHHEPVLVGADDFVAQGLERAKWCPPYDGPGNEHRGWRSPDAVSVEDGKLVITATERTRNDAAKGQRDVRDTHEVSGGVQWGRAMRYGEWRFSMRVDAEPGSGMGLTGPAVTLWPPDDVWPAHGEIDVFECRSASHARADMTVHWGLDGRNRFIEALPQQIEPSTWHDYVVRWLPDGTTGRDVVTVQIDDLPSRRLRLPGDRATSTAKRITFQLDITGRRTSRTPPEIRMEVRSLRIYAFPGISEMGKPFGRDAHGVHHLPSPQHLAHATPGKGSSLGG